MDYQSLPDRQDEAKKYYSEVNGKYIKLKYSYDFEWIKNYFETKYNEIRV